MNIQEVAEQTGVSAHTIRFYERCGVLPAIPRQANGIRQFSQADVGLLRFLLDLKRTCMSLEEITRFTEDGCICERLQQGDIPITSLRGRVAILQGHQQRLVEQQRQLTRLIAVVGEKLAFYRRYLEDAASHD